MFTETKKSIKNHLSTAARLLLSNSDADGAITAAKLAIDAGEIVDKVETVSNPTLRQPRKPKKPSR